ncbi:MAG TPA: ABC transporter permease [Verrucomicrobiae bacterium]|nr:ABC transporter permease [Verrucomicrobiae bacterium]
MSETLASSLRQDNPGAGHLGPNQRAWRRFQRNRPALISLLFLLGLLALVGSWPVMLNVAARGGARSAAWAEHLQPDRLSNDQFRPPTLAHLCGTDVHGRDLFSRILFGAQVSLLVGFVGAGISLVIGVLWGAIAGYVGGRTDGWMMRTVDVFYSLPSIIFVIVLVTTLEGGLKRVVMAFGIGSTDLTARLLLLVIGLGAVSWLTMARIVRGQVLTLRARPFVDASRALGAGPVRILFQHIIPNTLGIIITYLMLTIPGIILYESFLSYLGLGVEPPMASWGLLIAEGADQINPLRIYWWLIVFPAVFLVSTLLALNLVGDGLRDAWDVRAD